MHHPDPSLPPPTPSEIQTKDLNFAAYLSVLGCPLVSLSYEGNVCYWTYKTPASMEAMWLAFLSEPLLVPASKYASEIRDLKRQAMRRGR